MVKLMTIPRKVPVLGAPKPMLTKMPQMLGATKPMLTREPQVLGAATPTQVLGAPTPVLLRRRTAPRVGKQSIKVGKPRIISPVSDDHIAYAMDLFVLLD